MGDSVFFYRQKDSGKRWTKDAQQFVSQRLNLRHLNETRIKRTSLMKAFVTDILAIAAQIPSSTQQERSQRRQMHFQTAGLQRKGATRLRLKHHAEEEQLGCIELPTFYRTDRVLKNQFDHGCNRSRQADILKLFTEPKPGGNMADCAQMPPERRVVNDDICNIKPPDFRERVLRVHR